LSFGIMVITQLELDTSDFICGSTEFINNNKIYIKLFYALRSIYMKTLRNFNL
jgi:hypothetical protein